MNGRRVPPVMMGNVQCQYDKYIFVADDYNYNDYNVNDDDAVGCNAVIAGTNVPMLWLRRGTRSTVSVPRLLLE